MELLFRSPKRFPRANFRAILERFSGRGQPRTCVRTRVYVFVCIYTAKVYESILLGSYLGFLLKIRLPVARMSPVVLRDTHRADMLCMYRLVLLLLGKHCFGATLLK